MTRSISAWALVALAASLCGCGGGGDATSISLSTSSVTFTAAFQSPPPPPQTIHVTYKGDGLIVGYAPGIAPPNWLAVADAGHTATTAEISLQVTDTLTGGTRTTPLRFATGKADGSQIKFADVQVTWTVTGFPGGSPTSSGSAPLSISSSTDADDSQTRFADVLVTPAIVVPFAPSAAR